MFYCLLGSRQSGRDGTSHGSHINDLSSQAQGSVPASFNDGVKEQTTPQFNRVASPQSPSCGIEPKFDEKICKLSSATTRLVESVHRISLKEKRLSPYPRVSEVRMARSSSQRIRYHDFQKTPSAFSSLTFRNRRRSQKGSSDDVLAHGTAWLSLDGLLLDGEAATSSARIGGNLGPLEAATWEGFAPLQRVLLVAVTAAAAAGAKQRNLKEINRLQHAIENRDKESVLLHKEIAHLHEQLSFWKDRARPIHGEALYSKAIETFGSDESILPQIKYGLESTPKCASEILEQYATPQLGKGRRKRWEICGKRANHSMGRVGYLELQRMQLEEDSELSEKSVLDENTDVKPDLVAQSSHDSSHADENFEVFTPHLPFVQLHNIFTPQLPIDKASVRQGSPNSRFCQEGCRRTDASVDAPSVAMILRIKKEVQQLLQNEVAEVMAALSSVTEKVHILESINVMNVSVYSQLPHRQTAVDDVKQSIEQAAARISSLQVAFSNICHAAESEAMDTTNISHAKLDGCFAKLTGDQQYVSTSSNNQGWKQWLDHPVEGQCTTDESLCRRPDAEERRLSGTSDWSIDTSISDVSGTEQTARTDVVAAIQSAVMKTVDDLMAPLDERRNFGAVGNSPEIVIEQLLSELESAAAKVAGMEVQMKMLRATIKASERKREEAELRLTESKQRFDNQGSMYIDIVNLTERLQIKDEDSACSQQFIDAQTYKAPDKMQQDALFERDADKRLVTLKEACRAKDKTITRLKEQIAALQEKVSNLTEFQTPHLMKQNNRSSLTTMVTSNLLFNLDSPVKADSPRGANTALSWKGLQQSRVNNSFEEESFGGKTGDVNSSHICMMQNDTSFTKPGQNCFSNWQSVRNGAVKSGNVAICSTQIVQPKSGSGHARELKFSTVDLRFNEYNRRALSADGASRVARNEGNLRTNTHVLAGVEPNTPIRRRFRGKERAHRNLSNSVDSLSRAKENFSQRRRWM